MKKEAQVGAHKCKHHDGSTRAFVISLWCLAPLNRVDAFAMQKMHDLFASNSFASCH